MDITSIEIDEIIEDLGTDMNSIDDSNDSNDVAVIKGKIEMVVAQMEAMEISDQHTMEEAGEWLVKNKQTQKLVKDFFEPERKKTHEAYKAVTDQIKKFTDILTKSENVIKRKMSAYQMEQERIRREKERIQREEEAKRIAEQEAKQEARRKAAEESGEPIPEPDPEPEEVAQVAPIAEDEEKIDGVSFVENWTFVIDDTDKIPREYMVPDEKKIRQVVKALKGDADIPGIKIYAEKTVRARA